MHIVQIAPVIGPGSGVAGVAWNLEREFRAKGHEVEAFTFETVRRMTQRYPRHRVTAVLVAMWRTVQFSIIDTRHARKFLAERPDAVSIVHQNVMTGDIFVNHGVLFASFRARGHAMYRLLRNPMHVYTFLRDRHRYRSRIHRRIVVLAPSEIAAITSTYGRVQVPIAIIPNGVNLEDYRPPTPAERAVAREVFHLDDEHRVAVFVGYEFDRKGLPVAIRALVHAPTVLLLVIGGVLHMVESARRLAESLGVADRVLFIGPKHDIRQPLAASDMFVMPSAYEANALAILEALASGLPVVTTRVGAAPQLIDDGVNGYLVDRDPEQIGDRLERIASRPIGWFTDAARASVTDYSWDKIADQYLDLIREVAAERAAEKTTDATASDATR